MSPSSLGAGAVSDSLSVPTALHTVWYVVGTPHFFAEMNK